MQGSDEECQNDKIQPSDETWACIGQRLGRTLCKTDAELCYNLRILIWEQMQIDDKMNDMFDKMIEQL